MPSAEPPAEVPTTTLASMQPPPVSTPNAELGRLRLLVSPASEVKIDGTSIGSVTTREVPLAPGRHVVLIENSEYKPLQRVVSIAAGIETSLVIDLREKGIRRR